MKIVCISPQPLPSRPCTDPIFPREPGKLTAAFVNPHELQPEHCCYSPQREVKFRPSFAGGFQVPNASEEFYVPIPCSGVVVDPAQQRGSGRTGLTENWGDRKAARRTRQQSVGIREGILGRRECSRCRNRSFEEDQTDTLEQLKAEHQRKLSEIEAEYKQRRHKAMITPRSKAQRRHAKASNILSYLEKEAEKPSVPIEARLRYEGSCRQFQNRYNDKLQCDAASPVQFSPFLVYIFRTLDRDQTGLINKADLVKELHQNTELAPFFGFKETDQDWELMDAFQSLGDNITFEQFHAFFCSFARSPTPPKAFTEQSESPIPRKAPHSQAEKQSNPETSPEVPERRTPDSQFLTSPFSSLQSPSLKQKKVAWQTQEYSECLPGSRLSKDYTKETWRDSRATAPMFAIMNQEQQARHSQESLQRKGYSPAVGVLASKEPVVPTTYRIQNVPSLERMRKAFQKTIVERKHIAGLSHEDEASWGLEGLQGVESRDIQKLKDMIEVKKRQLMEREEAKRRVKRAEEITDMQQKTAIKVGNGDESFSKHFAEMQRKMTAKPLLTDSIETKQAPQRFGGDLRRQGRMASPEDLKLLGQLSGSLGAFQ